LIAVLPTIVARRGFSARFEDHNFAATHNASTGTCIDEKETELAFTWVDVTPFWKIEYALLGAYVLK